MGTTHRACACLMTWRSSLIVSTWTSAWVTRRAVACHHWSHGDAAPRTCDNFEALCFGSRRQSLPWQAPTATSALLFTGSYRISWCRVETGPEAMVLEAGPCSNPQNLRMKSEGSSCPMQRLGLCRWPTLGPNTNSSQFFIT